MRRFEGNKRSLGMVVLLTILTCGIYYLVWVYQTTEMLAQFNQDQQTDGTMVVILHIVTCGLYGLYWWYKISQMFVTSQKLAGRQLFNDNAVLLIILSLFGCSIISMVILQSDLNNFWDALD